MNIYCVKCQKDTENIDSKMFRTKNNRLIMNQNILSVELKSQDLLKNKKQRGNIE